MAQPFPTLDVAGQTDVGLKRTRNEDSFTVQMPPAGSPISTQGAMFIVCDGMGGMGGGDVASKTAIEEIIKTFYDPSVTNDYDPLPRLRNALEAANVRVRETAQSVGLPRIGATGAGMILTATGDAVVFNIGDSRVYRARGSYIELLTRDQSVMASQLEAGLVSQEEARLSRNVNVTAFIGQPMPISPVYSRMQTQPGDVFIICSDGVWDLIEPNEFLKAVQSPAKEAAAKLIAQVRQRGAPDNATVIIVRVGTAARKIPVLPIVAGALIVLAAIGGFALARSGAFTDNRPAPTNTPLPTLTSAPPSPTIAVAIIAASEEATPEMTQGASPVVSMSTLAPASAPTRSTATQASAATEAIVAARATEAPTTAPSATKRATATDQPTLAASSTARPSATPKATETAPPTVAPTSTTTATVRPSATSAPTDTPPATATDVPPPTLAPSATTPPLPTVTVNPTLITFTPSPPPTGGPTALPPDSGASRDAFLLTVARGDGAVLNSPAVLELYDASATAEATVELTAYLATMESAQAVEMPPVTAETTAAAEATVDGVITLDAGTQVHLFGDQARMSASGTALVLVEVTSGDHLAEIGWLDVRALLQASPAAPYVLPGGSVAKGVNVRSGESQLSPVVDVLLVGQYARLIAVSTSPLGWYYIELPSGGKGWVSPNNVTVEGNRSGLKRLTPPPTPTFTPAPTVTPALVETTAAGGAG